MYKFVTCSVFYIKDMSVRRPFRISAINSAANIVNNSVANKITTLSFRSSPNDFDDHHKYIHNFEYQATGAVIQTLNIHAFLKWDALQCDYTGVPRVKVTTSGECSLC